jgi:magnesium transporter
MKMSEKSFLSGADVLLWLFETQIGYNADLLESISRNITQVFQNLMSERSIDTDGILTIINLQEKTLTLKESITDKKRVLSSFKNSGLFPQDRKPRLENILEDISSLLEFIPMEMERMGNLQQTQKNLSLQEQKKIIHVSMVYATGILLAILIADIFSMNLPNIPIPGLASSFGFWLCIGLISLSSIGIAIHLRNKKWT